jgi:hypothetical protein
MIKIIREPDIHLTEDELRRYEIAYRDFCHHHVSPPSFEAFVRSNPFKYRSFAEALAEVHRLSHKESS